MLPATNDSKDIVVKKGFNTDSMDNIYGRAINNYKELFTGLFANKKDKFSLEKIKDSVKEIIKFAIRLTSWGYLFSNLFISK